jgi:DnaJ-class molecular chaperone
MKDLYKILNVSKDASENEIKSSYRKLALEHHPDRGGDAEKFKDINQAYEILSDQDKRDEYDTGGSLNSNPFPGFDFASFNQQFQNFGFNFQSHMMNQTQSTQQKTIQGNIKLTLTECYLGVKKSINFITEDACDMCAESCKTCNGTGHIEKIQRINTGLPMNFCQRTIQMCTDCNGSCKTFKTKNCKKCNGEHKIKNNEKIELDVFPGIHERDVININISKNNKIYNLLIRCEINYDKFYRDESNLIYKLDLPFINSIIGQNNEISLPDNKKVLIESLKFNEIIENKKRYETEYNGLPIFDKRTNQITGYGKLYIEYNIEYPKINIEIIKDSKNIDCFTEEFNKLIC